MDGAQRLCPLIGTSVAEVRKGPFKVMPAAKGYMATIFDQPPVYAIDETPGAGAEQGSAHGPPQLTQYAFNDREHGVSGRVHPRLPDHEQLVRRASTQLKFPWHPGQTPWRCGSTMSLSLSDIAPGAQPVMS